MQVVLVALRSQRPFKLGDTDPRIASDEFFQGWMEKQEVEVP